MAFRHLRNARSGWLAAPADPSWAWSLLYRYIGHETTDDGHQDINKLPANISGLKHIASKVSGASGPAKWVVTLAWRPGAQVVVRVVSSGH